jgi:hypothetical protein
MTLIRKTVEIFIVACLSSLGHFTPDPPKRQPRRGPVGRRQDSRQAKLVPRILGQPPDRRMLPPPITAHMQLSPENLPAVIPRCASNFGGEGRWEQN